MVSSFRQYRIESAHCLDEHSQVVIVNQFGISEYLWGLTKKIFYKFGVFVDLFNEFVPRIEEAETMVVGFSEEFDAAGPGEGIKGADDFRCIKLELFEQCACNAVCYFESAVVFIYYLQHQAVCGEITFVCHFFTDGGIFVVVEVQFVAVKYRIMS
jgi:hypothetical protein